MAEGRWKRPEHVVYPSVWRRFIGKKKHSSGKDFMFKIQDVTPDLYEAVLQHMLTIFLRDEPLSANKKITDNPEAVSEMRYFWTKMLQQKLASVCLLENYNELNDLSLPFIVGCNMTLIKEKGVEEFGEPKTKEVKAFLDIMEDDIFDCFEHYQCTEYLYAYGLSVDPFYRGQSVGTELLKARLDLCRAVGLKATVTVFTSLASQKVAAKVGFVTHAVVDYDDYRVDGELVYTNMPNKSIVLAGVKIEND